MTLRTASPRQSRDTAAYLFDLAVEAGKEFHDARSRGDAAEMALMGLLKSACLFVAAELTDGDYLVRAARDQTHRPLLTVQRCRDLRDLHVPLEHWTKLKNLRDDRFSGGSKA